MTIQNDKKGTVGQTIQLTVASTTDQTQKVRVEVPPGTSVMDAVRKAGLADGQVDVFDSMGQVVTRSQADALGNQTVYVGPKRVAGGGDDWELVDIDLDDLANHGAKPITFASVLNEEVRAEIVPENQETLRQCGQRSGLAPRDGSGWAVYDDMGFEVSDQIAKDSGAKTVWIGPKAIDAGSMDITPGLKDEELKRMQIHYPSTRAVRSLRLAGGQAGAVVLNVPGVRSHRDSAVVQYQILLDLREFPSKTPRAYVISPESSEIEHCNVFRGDRYEVAGSQTICAVCLGNIDEVFTSFRKERRARLNMFLNHLQNVMNSPNPSDTARSV
jgi:hypothetical protein